MLTAPSAAQDQQTDLVILDLADVITSESRKSISLMFEAANRRVPIVGSVVVVPGIQPHATLADFSARIVEQQAERLQSAETWFNVIASVDNRDIEIRTSSNIGSVTHQESVAISLDRWSSAPPATDSAAVHLEEVVRVLLVEILKETGVPIDDSDAENPSPLLSPIEATLVDLQSQIATDSAEVDAQIRRIADLLPRIMDSLSSEESEFRAANRDALDSLRRQLQGDIDPCSRRASYDLCLSILLSLIAELQDQLGADSRDENLIRLRDEAAGTTNRLRVAVRRFNETAERLQSAIALLPSSYLWVLHDTACLEPLETPPRSAGQGQ